MHPILAERGRLLIYIAAWLPLGALLAVLVSLVGPAAWTLAGALAVPLAPALAFLCLAAWYPSRSAPLVRTQAWRAVASQALGAIISSFLWLLLGAAWAYLLDRLRPDFGAYALFSEISPLLFVLGLLLYLLAAAASYLLIAVEASNEAERRALEATKNQELQARELGLARNLQQRLLPPAERDGRGFRLAARNLAASYVAGDFYDYFRVADGGLRIAVADVAGKGMSASLIMATVKAVLPLIAAEGSVVETMSKLNLKLTDELARRQFVALALAGYDPESGRVELVNAGLPDPYLLRPGAPPRAVEAPQPRLPLGLRSDLAYRSVTVDLAPGDRLVFLTDGLPEAPVGNDEPLGYNALPGLFDHAADAPGEWLDALLERLREATTGELEDDWTAVLLERPLAEPT